MPSRDEIASVRLVPVVDRPRSIASHFTEWLGGETTGIVAGFRYCAYGLDGGPYNGNEQGVSDGAADAMQYAKDNNLTCLIQGGEVGKIYQPYPHGKIVCFSVVEVNSLHSFGAWVYTFHGLKESNGTFSGQSETAWLEDGVVKSVRTDGLTRSVFHCSNNRSVHVYYQSDGNGGCTFWFGAPESS